MLGQRPVRCGLADLRKCILGEAPDLDAQVEHRLEALRGLESRRIAALHAGRQRSKGIPPEQCSRGLPLGLKLRAGARSYRAAKLNQDRIYGAPRMRLGCDSFGSFIWFGNQQFSVPGLH